VRSIVGLLPLCAVSVYRREVAERLPGFMARVKWFNENRPDLLANLSQRREARAWAAATCCR
jgi:hypothetical protein